jgi:hypothetical protein
MIPSSHALISSGIDSILKPALRRASLVLASPINSGKLPKFESDPEVPCVKFRVHIDHIKARNIRKADAFIAFEV